MTINEIIEKGVIGKHLGYIILSNAEREFIKLFECERVFCGIHYVDGHLAYDRYIFKGAVAVSEIAVLTVKDLFDLLGEKCISRWPNIGPKTLEELKGLI